MPYTRIAKSKVYTGINAHVFAEIIEMMFVICRIVTNFKLEKYLKYLVYFILKIRKTEVQSGKFHI